MQQFEFRDYGEDASRINPVVTFLRLRGDTAARAKAGRIAKNTKGPVDLAYAGSAEWSERYITTANPCEFTASGYRFERLEN